MIDRARAAARTRRVVAIDIRDVVRESYVRS